MGPIPIVGGTDPDRRWDRARSSVGPSPIVGGIAGRLGIERDADLAQTASVYR
jgi:hypothetical protein